MSNNQEPPRGTRRVENQATTEGLPVAPSLGNVIDQVHIPPRPSLMDGRALKIVALAIGLGLAAGFVAEILRWLIALVTNLAFFGRWSVADAAPADAVPHLGWWVVGIPVIGGLIVGVMARYGSRGIRGHGIPEAMEQVLTNQSRIPARITWLKPLSAAIAIGTGGPFGAEGPIIATGGALGSLLGQIVPTTTMERKTLLAAGAAAGMAAIFGSPVSAVLLAVELLLFEFRPRSLVPVALAASAAAAVRFALLGPKPAFDMPVIGMPEAGAMVAYVLIGALIGVIATLVTRAVYAVEDAFEHFPIHWMWWPAIGAVAVGVIGYFVPLTLGVGYSNISGMLGGGHFPNHANGALTFVAILVAAKFLSWVIALGSGTSGGTMAPLFTIGGGLGLLMGALANYLFPGAHIDIHVTALVGMAAIFAGASRAMLASIVFAFETTLQPMGLLPLLGGCSMAYLVSCVLMRNTIMTEKIARRGVRVPVEYASDFLDQVLVKDAASANVIALPGDKTLAEARGFLLSQEKGSRHQGFPILNQYGHLLGVLTRRDLVDGPPGPPGHETKTLESLLRRPPVVVYDDCSLREAADHMVRHDIGRLPVISRRNPGKLVGIITRSDLLKAHRQRIKESQEPAAPTVTIPFLKLAD